MNPLQTLPPRWAPSREVAQRLVKDHGTVVDLRLALDKFRAHYSEGQASRNWDAKFVVWVLTDVQRIREKQAGGTNDLGVPHNQSTDRPVALEPGDPGYVDPDELAELARQNGLAVQEEQP